MEDNIFSIGPVVTGESFIGRKKDLKEFAKRLEVKQKFAVSLVGLTRFGKSSLIANSFNKQICLNNAVLYCYIETLGEFVISDSDYSYFELWKKVIFEIYPQVKEIGQMDETLEAEINKLKYENIPWIKFINTIKKIFEILKEKGLKTLLIFDEFDRASDVFGKKTQYWEFCRTLFSGAKYAISAITISRRQLHTIEGTTYQSSTFHGVFEPVYLKGFDESDMEEYFEVFSKKYGIELNDSQKERIVYYAGNAPYLLSIIGYNIVDAAIKKEDIDIDKIFSDKCNAINNYYRDCIKHLERDGDLKRIVPFIIGPNIGVTKNDKDELVNLGYFREENGRLVAISEYFVEFLSANMLQLNIWDEIINLEKKLKQLVERELTRLVRHFSAAGNDINEVFKFIMEKTPHIEVGDILRYDVFLQNNKNVFNLNSSYLDVMSMKDVIKIIKERWLDVFAVYFNNDKFSDWEAKFNKCSRARNPIAHGHEEYLTDLDKTEVDTYCKQIYDTIEKNTKNVSADSTDFLEIARQNLEKHPAEPEQYQEPDRELLGNTAQMYIRKKGDKNLHGDIENGKYKCIIPKNYLYNVDLDNKLKSTVEVLLEKIQNGAYIVKPLSKFK